MAAKGEKYQDRPVDVLTVEPFNGAPRGQQFLAVDFRQNAVNITDKDGNVARTTSTGEEERYVVLIWRQGGWRLLEIENTPQSENQEN